MKVNGKLCHLWRAVDHEGEVLESVVTAKRDKAAAVKLLKRIMKKYGRPRMVVTDGLRAYSAAMREVGTAGRQEVGRGCRAALRSLDFGIAIAPGASASDRRPPGPADPAAGEPASRDDGWIGHHIQDIERSPGRG